jgi:hypothetical protein
MHFFLGIINTRIGTNVGNVGTASANTIRIN